MGIEFGRIRSTINDDLKYIKLIGRLLELMADTKLPEHGFVFCAWSMKEPRFVMVSDEYCRAVGMTRDEAMSRTFIGAIDPNYVGEGMREWERNSNLQESKFRNIRSDHLHKDGHSVPMWWDGVNDAAIGVGIGLVYFYERH